MPPMRIAGGLVRNTRTPGTRASFGRSSVDDLIGRQRALVARLEVDVEAAAAEPPTLAV